MLQLRIPYIYHNVREHPLFSFSLYCGHICQDTNSLRWLIASKHLLKSFSRLFLDMSTIPTTKWTGVKCTGVFLAAGKVEVNRSNLDSWRGVTKDSAAALTVYSASLAPTFVENNNLTVLLRVCFYPRSKKVVEWKVFFHWPRCLSVWFPAKACKHTLKRPKCKNPVFQKWKQRLQL